MEDLNVFPPSDPAAGGTKEVDFTEPAVLVLSGQHVVSKAAPEAPLYKMSRDVTSIPQENSSIIFERVEDTRTTETDRYGPEKQQNRHIFYLAHPERSGIPDGNSCPLHHVCIAGADAREHQPSIQKVPTPEAKF